MFRYLVFYLHRTDYLYVEKTSCWVLFTCETCSITYYKTNITKILKFFKFLLFTWGKY